MYSISNGATIMAPVMTIQGGTRDQRNGLRRMLELDPIFETAESHESGESQAVGSVLVLRDRVSLDFNNAAQ